MLSVDQLIERYALLTTVVHPVVVVGLTPVGVVQPMHRYGLLLFVRWTIGIGL